MQRSCNPGEKCSGQNSIGAKECTQHVEETESIQSVKSGRKSSERGMQRPDYMGPAHKGWIRDQNFILRSRQTNAQCKETPFAWEGLNFFLVPLFVCVDHQAMISSATNQQVNSAGHLPEWGSPSLLAVPRTSSPPLPWCHGEDHDLLKKLEAFCQIQGYKKLPSWQLQTDSTFFAGE